MTTKLINNFFLVKSNTTDVVNVVDPIRRDVAGVGAEGTTLRFVTDRPGEQPLV
ncbi:hypothetical protein C0992_003673 [Termitomyces sp. T32_za158]|nr:hypothetical protein C0992_003673 [Termitomyces sp. T32_za158]